MLAAVLGALVIGAFAAGQSQDEATSLPGVTVTGIRNTPEEARRFVDEVANRPSQALTLSTWRRPICLQVLNMREPARSTIMAQIEARAADVGVTVAPTGCWPNVTVLATSDGRFTASELVSAYGDRFRPTAYYTVSDDRDLARFMESDAPVRWWQVAALTDDESGKILPAPRGAPVQMFDTTGEPYFGQNRRDTILTTLVILDLSRTQGASDVAVGGYVAMVVLADIDPDADAGSYPTVLNLWREGRGAGGMTAWDRAYLKGLYGAGVRLPGSGLQTRSLYQLNEMARIISQELALAQQ